MQPSHSTDAPRYEVIVESRRLAAGQIASSHPATLPNEVLDLILSNVPQPATLFSISRCCRTFALLAERWLYSSLRFTAGSKAMKLARTLVHSTRKSQLVLAVTAELIDVDFILLPAGLKLVVAAIVGCPNLADLSVAWRYQYEWATSCMLSNHFQLRHFTTVFHWDESVCRFLETQPKVQELRVVRPGPDYARGGSTEPYLDSLVLPHLSSFEGRLPQALTVVPGRPVRSLVLYGAVTLTHLESALPRLARATVQIESLSLQAGELSSKLLDAISYHLPSLTRFELRIVRYSMIAYSDLTSESFCQALSLMSHLDYFRLRIKCPQLFYVPYYHTQRDVVLEWKSHCLSLKRIVFESSSENIAPEWTFDEEAVDWVCSLDD